MNSTTLIIARPRSGTSAFRSVLERSRGAHVLSEVFHNDQIEQPASFFNYYRAAIRKDPDLAMPSPANRHTLFNGYVDHLCTQFNFAADLSRRLLLTVNYNSLHCLNTYWQNMYEAPFMANIIKYNSYKVLHIVRRNIVAAALSEARAVKTGLWHRRVHQDGESQEVPKIKLDPQAFLAELRIRRNEIDLWQRTFAHYPHKCEVLYEDLFDAAGEPNPDTLQRVLQFIDLPEPAEAKTNFKITRTATFAETIENYDEVMGMLKTSEFAEFVGP